MTDQLSVQLYTVREALAADLNGTLRRLADIGFTQVEPFGIADRRALVDGLAEAGLAAPTAHAHFIDDPDPDLFRLARNLGVSTLIDPSAPGRPLADARGRRPARGRAERCGPRRGGPRPARRLPQPRA